MKKKNLFQLALFVIFILVNTEGILAQCSTSSTPTSDCTLGDAIDIFSLAGTPTVGNAGCSNPATGYTSYPTPVRSLQQGQMYPWSANVGGGVWGEGMGIWIDLNNNGIYESSEMVANGFPATSHAGNITIPTTATAATGIKMRTRCIYAQSFTSGNACLTGFLGETEDYLIDITCATLTAPTAASPVTVCSGQSATLTASTTTGVLKWYTVSTGGSSVATGSPFVTPPLSANTSYYVASETPGCSGSTRTQVQVNVQPSPTPSLSIAITSGSNPSCAGMPVTFTATPANGGTSPAYQWNVNGANAGSNSSTYNSSTVSDNDVIYCVLTSNAACANPSTDTSNSITMSVISLSVNAGVDVSICTGSSTTLNGTGNGSYLWSPSAGLSDPAVSNPVASPASTTTYTLTVTNSCGSVSDEVTVTITTTPSVNAGNDVTICMGNSVQLNAAGSGTFTWSPVTGLSCINCPNPQASPNITTIYTVTINDSCGTASDEVTVTVDSCVTGISSISGNINIIISPNPTTGKIQIQLAPDSYRDSNWQLASSQSVRTPSEQPAAIVEIYNVYGETVYSEKILNPKSLILNLDFPPGIYFIKILTNEGLAVKKIIKQ